MSGLGGYELRQGHLLASLGVGPGGSRHTIDMPRMYVASNSTSESTRQAARNIYVRLVFNDSGLSSASLGGFVVSSGHLGPVLEPFESLLEAILSHRGLY